MYHSYQKLKKPYSMLVSPQNASKEAISMHLKSIKFLAGGRSEPYDVSHIQISQGF